MTSGQVNDGEQMTAQLQESQQSGSKLQRGCLEEVARQKVLIIAVNRESQAKLWKDGPSSGTIRRIKSVDHRVTMVTDGETPIIVISAE